MLSVKLITLRIFFEREQIIVWNADQTQIKYIHSAIQNIEWVFNKRIRKKNKIKILNALHILMHTLHCVMKCAGEYEKTKVIKHLRIN